MRPQSLTRLVRVNQTVCLRLLQRRNVSGRRNPDKIPRQRDQKAKENFVSNAVTKSVSELMKKPHRDKYSYDKYPPIQFSTPIISALHARIGLPASFPLSTLTRCLTDPSQERDHTLHNEALSQIGAGLLEYYVSEYLCVRWPRLPMPTQLSALWAYTGESALTRIAREWGVESQSLERTPPHKKEGNVKFAWEVKEQARQGWLETRGNAKTGDGMLNNLADKEYENRFVLYAMQRFVQSLVGGVYDITVTQDFIKAHILSRTLPPLSSLYHPTRPTQEVTRLCERLKIPLPISRLIAESGRHTRDPVFVVGVYSGRERLGEGQGRSIPEAKTRANTNALRAWYLYEQAGWEFALPSRTEDAEKTYVMGYVDPGSIVT